jgi:hypothetical protein
VHTAQLSTNGCIDKPTVIYACSGISFGSISGEALIHAVMRTHLKSILLHERNLIRKVDYRVMLFV